MQITATDRQWSHDRTMFLIHPPSHTDSFTLFTKSVILLSHIKNLNLRFRGRYFSGDPSVHSPSPLTPFKSSLEPEGRGSTETLDPRGSPAFKELDGVASMFRQSFPSYLKNPTQDDMVDPYLFCAFSGAFLYVVTFSLSPLTLESSTLNAKRIGRIIGRR